MRTRRGAPRTTFTSSAATAAPRSRTQPTDDSPGVCDQPADRDPLGGRNPRGLSTNTGPLAHDGWRGCASRCVRLQVVSRGLAAPPALWGWEVGGEAPRRAWKRAAHAARLTVPASHGQEPTGKAGGGVRRLRL